MPFAATDDGFAACGGRFLGDVLGKLVATQVTGGSSTPADGCEKMRVAA